MNSGPPPMEMSAHAAAPGAEPPRTVIVPRAALLAAGAMVVLVTLLALLRPDAAVAPPVAAVLQARALQFADCADGAVMVTDAGTARLVALERGQLGFLRQTMRGLALYREAQGGARNTPFLLRYYADRRLVLQDPATQRQIELEAFGPANEAVFAALLTADAGPGIACPGRS